MDGKLRVEVEIGFSEMAAGILWKLLGIAGEKPKPTIEEHMAAEIERRRRDEPVHDMREPVFPEMTAPVSQRAEDAPVAEPKKRRGRPPGSGKTAEQQTQALEQQPVAPENTAPAAIPPGVAIPPGAAIPPGVSAPAMPSSAPVPEASGDGVSFDDLRECFLQANQKNSKLAYKMLRAKTWSDGSEKPTWFTLESVPAEMRERLMDETMALLQ